MGPNAGTKGGEIVAQGTIKEIKNNQNSETGLYLSKERNHKIPKKGRNYLNLLKLKEHP